VRASHTAVVSASAKTVMSPSPIMRNPPASRRRIGGVDCEAFCHDGVTPNFFRVEHVADMVRGAGLSDDVPCGAYLHDVCEHAAVARGVILNQFGPVVFRLVDALTQPSVVPETRRRVGWARHRSPRRLLRSAN
jgi:hypothetical protein